MPDLTQFFGGEAFVPDTIERTSTADVFPPGDYPAMIEASDMKATKAGDGQYLEITYQILDGPFKGRKFWDRLNLHNPNQLAMTIARECLANICDACGVSLARQTEELHGKTLVLAMKIDKKGDNRVRKYKPIAEYVPNAQPAATPPVAPAPAPVPQPAAPAAVQPAAAVPVPQPVPQAPPVQAVHQQPVATPVAATPVQAQQPMPWQQPQPAQ
jgi:hypothetical protein